MGLNLAEIQQKLDRLIQNMSEQNRRAYQIFYDPNPQDVTLPQLDENGNLVNVTIPNRAKIKAQLWDDVGGALGQFNKVVYVDAQNGDDNNPGTADAPFKTIRKAVDSVPTGSIGVIVLKNGQTHYLPADDDIYILGKQILFVAWSSTVDSNGDGSYPYTNPPTIYFSKKNNGTVSKFILGGNSCIGFGRWGRGVVLEDDPNAPLNDIIIYGHCDTVPNIGQSFGYKKLSVAHSYIKLKKARLTAMIDEVSFRLAKIFFDDSDSSHLIFDVGWGTLRFEVDAGDLVKYDGSASIGWNNIGNYIHYIIRDSNGTPRNIVSNIIL